MQKSFVVKKAVHLSGGYDINGRNIEGFLTRPGDILVFDAQNNNNLTIYRNEQIARVLPGQSSISIEALVKGRFFDDIKDSPSALPAPELAVVELPVIELPVIEPVTEVVGVVVVEPEVKEKPKAPQAKPQVKKLKVDDVSI
jgi:hypothetical protein